MLIEPLPPFQWALCKIFVQGPLAVEFVPGKCCSPCLDRLGQPAGGQQAKQLHAAAQQHIKPSV